MGLVSDNGYTPPPWSSGTIELCDFLMQISGFKRIVGKFFINKELGGTRSQNWNREVAGVERAHWRLHVGIVAPGMGARL